MAVCGHQYVHLNVLFLKCCPGGPTIGTHGVPAQNTYLNRVWCYDQVRLANYGFSKKKSLLIYMELGSDLVDVE